MKLKKILSDISMRIGNNNISFEKSNNKGQHCLINRTFFTVIGMACKSKLSMQFSIQQLTNEIKCWIGFIAYYNHMTYTMFPSDNCLNKTSERKMRNKKNSQNSLHEDFVNWKWNTHWIRYLKHLVFLSIGHFIMMFHF